MSEQSTNNANEDLSEDQIVDLEQDFSFYPQSKQEIQKCYDDVEIFSNSSNKNDSQEKKKSCCQKFQQKISYFIFLLFQLLLSICVLLGSFAIYVSILFSFVCVIIVIFVFFISFITAYVMSPIYLSLSNDWIEFVAAILQVILTSPLVAFFIYFFVNSIIKCGDILDTFSDFMRLAKLPFVDTKRTARQTKEDSISLCESICFAFTSLLLISLFLAIGILFAWVTFLLPSTIVFGVLIFIPSIIELVLLLIPTYIDFFKVLFCMKYSKEDEPDDISKKLGRWIKDKLIHTVKTFDVDSDSEDEKRINQETQTFINGKGQFSTQIGYSEKYYDFEVLNSIDTVQSTKNDFFDEMSIFFKQIKPIIFVKEFIPLYSYGKTIARDQYKRKLKTVLLWIFTILNLVLVGFDLYRASKHYTQFFLGSTIVRLFLIPLFAFFHIFTQLLVTAKDKVLAIIIHIASIFTFIIVIAIFAVMLSVNIYHDLFRIHEYTHLPVNESVRYVNSKLLSHPICLYNVHDVDAIAAYSYALGPYDVFDNPHVFNESMKTFFGENYSEFIEIKPYHISDSVPFIIYNNTKIHTLIIAFRGFNSGPEIALLIEMVAHTYIIPFFSDLIPFMETLTDFWLETEFNIASRLGRNMFDPTNLMREYEEAIEKICLQNHIDEYDRVLFTGISTGAYFAKIAGMRFKKYSISFLTLPIYNDFVTHTFGIEGNEMAYVTNVYVYDSYFTISEPEYATNIGIYGTAFDSKIDSWCKSGICEFNMKRESNYPSFCQIVGLCGKNAEYDHFCRVALRNNDDLDQIRDFIMEL